MNDENQPSLVENVVSVLITLKSMMFNVIGILGTSIQGYRIIRKFIWGRKEAREYKETLRNIERQYGEINGIVEVLQRKSRTGNIDSVDMSKLHKSVTKLGRLISELPVDIKDPHKIEFPKIPTEEYEAFRKDFLHFNHISGF